VHGIHHQAEGGVQELLGRFGIQALDESGGVLDVGKEDGDLFALACQGGSGSEDLVGEMGRGVGQRRCVRRPSPHRRVGGWWGRCRSVAGPDQDFAVLINGQALRHNDLIFQVLQAGIVKPELPLQGVIGHASPLAQ
jgi:hypothetical protein